MAKRATMNGKSATARIEAGDDATEQAMLDAAAENLTADVMQAMLQEIRDAKNQKPWAQMNEREQAEVIDRVRGAASTLTRRAVGIIAAKGFRTISAHFEAGSFKDGELAVDPGTGEVLDDKPVFDETDAALELADA